MPYLRGRTSGIWLSKSASGAVTVGWDEMLFDLAFDKISASADRQDRARQLRIVVYRHDASRSIGDN
jgi:hypothetical protein